MDGLMSHMLQRGNPGFGRFVTSRRTGRERGHDHQYFAGVLPSAEAFVVERMLARVLRPLAGVQGNKDGGITGCPLGGQGVRGADVFLANTATASPDGRRLETR